MPLILPNEGLPDQLGYILRAPISGVVPWELRLWTNDLVPEQATILSELVWATFPGYFPVTMDRNAWTVPVVEDDVAVSTWGGLPVMWTNGGTAQTVYGYAAVDVLVGVLRIVERFADPVAVESGGQIGVLPRYTFGTAPSA